MRAFTIPSIFTAIDKLSGPVKKMEDSVATFAARAERSFRKVGDVSASIAKTSFLVGALFAAPLIYAGNEAIKFEDRMADVGKTTGLAGKELESFGKDLLGLAPDTRTSIAELQEIAAIGGSMGVAKTELLGFTDSVNKFNVALGSDFGGVQEASKAISGLKTLFKETRDIDVASSITKTGSAINALSSKGVNVQELTEFTSRIGQLPDAIKPSIQSTAALGATLNKAGISAEIGSRAFGDILLTAAQNLPKFASQMNISEKAARKLINSDPTSFAVKFAESLDGLDAVQLSKTLKGLKLTDAGAIKVVGALSSSTKILTDFQKISNDEFKKGTSLLDEYNTKNETTAARLKKAQNNFQALAIIVGTELLPPLSKVVTVGAKVLKKIIAWTKENPGLTKTIVIGTAAIATLAFTVSIVSGAIALVTKSIAAWGLITKAFTAVQWLLNSALLANPIGLIIIGIVALIVVISAVVKWYHEWGAALTLLMGPFGMIINIIQSFRRNWEMIEKAFTNGGILQGIFAIGKAILDAILMPIQQVLEIIAKVTKADWATDAVQSIEKFRKDLGVNVTTNESGDPIADKALLNPEAERQGVLKETINTQRQNVAIDINDRTGRASVDPGNNMIPIKLTSTLGFGK
jgi:TP901 family phage tail tape measure protein